MRWLIDGNNVLHAGDDIRRGSRAGRLWLAGLLADWAKKTGEKVRVVFDGPAPRDEITTMMQRGGIDADFSGERSADDVIADLICDDTGPKHLTVVSSDRAVRSAAERAGAAAMLADDFLARVQRELRAAPEAPAEPPQKESGPTPEEADRWFDELACDDLPDLPPY